MGYLHHCLELPTTKPTTTLSTGFVAQAYVQHHEVHDVSVSVYCATSRGNCRPLSVWKHKFRNPIVLPQTTDCTIHL